MSVSFDAHRLGKEQSSSLTQDQESIYLQISLGYGENDTCTQSHDPCMQTIDTL